jgi:hypothetical protein
MLRAAAMRLNPRFDFAASEILGAGISSEAPEFFLCACEGRD